MNSIAAVIRRFSGCKVKRVVPEVEAVFDVDFYLRRNPDIAASGKDPLTHYLNTGWAEGRDPSPLFDNDAYLRANVDVAQAGLNPLLHFIGAGARENRNPHPLFFVDWYLARNPDVAGSRVNPLVHYLTTGSLERRWPNPLFDPEWYRARAHLSGEVNPLAHYIETGAAAGIAPHPLFDSRWYLERNPDVAEAGGNPLAHYLMQGGVEKRQPHPLFDAFWYIEQNPDVAAAGVNPLVHYATQGWREGRDPNPLFGTAWYLKQNPDVAAAGVNPLVHYATQGWRERRDPNPLFEIAWYLTENPDVASAGIDPLTHFSTQGWRERRRPSARFDARCDLETLREFVHKGARPPERSLRMSHLERGDRNNSAPGNEGSASTAASAKDGSALKSQTSQYATLRQEVLSSGLWDENWYLANYYESYREYKKGKVNGELLFPLDYYLQEGWKRGHEPSNRLPVQIDQKQVGCSKIEYFLNVVRFDGYQFDENIWKPSDKRIAEYRARRRRKSKKSVMYTCIVKGYDELIQPYYISDDWEYVCFTDDQDLLAKGRVGVWSISPMSNVLSNATRTNRWYKMHPHILFPEYRESIYIDGNINVLSDYIFKQISIRNSNILIPKHFVRDCIYQEIIALLHSSRISQEDKAFLVEQRKFLEKENFPEKFGLCENNLIYRKHNEPEIIQIMDDWWEIYGNYSSRDQASLAYVFWKHGLSLRDRTFANCRVNYRDFAVVKHLPDRPLNRVRLQALTPAFAEKNIAVVFSTNEQFIPYLGVAIFSLLENADQSYNYDIVILARGLNGPLAKLCELANGRSNVSIRIYDTTALIESLPAGIFHVEGYVPVETYNKCFITEILSGYDRCAYLDSDILVVGNVQELHDVELGGRSVGASVNVANVNAAFCKKDIKGKRFDEYLVNELGVMDPNEYFQAGVLVLDMNKLYQRDMRQLTIDALKEVEKPIFFDQCIFNRIFYGDVAFFSTAWNHVWYMQQYSYLRGSVPDDVFFDYAHGRVEPKIIHYAGKAKPQNHLGWKLADRFWDYTYRSPFIEEIRNDVLKKGSEVTPYLSNEPDWEWSRVKPRVLVHMHLYYVDQIEAMLDALGSIVDCDFDLFVTMVEKDEVVEGRVREVSGGARFIILPNAGYDVYPFLHVLKEVRLANYEFVLKFHTKNARRPGQDEVYGIKVPGYQWRDELLNAIVGSKDIFRKNLNRLLDDSTLGCIGAEKFIFSTRENNEEKTYSLPEWREKCGVSKGKHYVGGSMFFARAYPFERLKGLNMRPDDFMSPNMGTKDYKNKAHVFERLFGIVFENEGFRIEGS